jgi:transcriptional regulator with XRE-family HTH domain
VNEFASRMGISQPAASQLLSGHYTPGARTQEKLRRLGCDIEWLMTGKSGYKVAEESEVYYLRQRVSELEKEKHDLARKLKAIETALNPHPPPLKYPRSRKHHAK